MARQGGCMCGAVTYKITADVKKTGACHCGMCRAWSGGVFLSVEVPPGGLEVSGEVAAYASSDWAERVFCPTCGSSLWYRLKMAGPQQGTCYVGFGTLKETDGMEFEGEIYIDRKPKAYAFEGSHARMTEAEFLKSIGMAG